MTLIFENIRIALRALMANKLRSILTMLGIIIGVGAVVALLSIGQGATASITSSVEGLGSNLVIVAPGRLFNREGGSQNAKLYYSDYEAIAANGTNMNLIVPMYQTMGTVKYNDKDTQLSLAGVTEDYAAVRAYKLAQGRFIDAIDRNQNSQVAVLGSQTASDLFGNLSPIGQRIKIDSVSFDVIGVLEPKGSGGFGSEDDIVLIPLETGYTKLFGSTAEDSGKRLISSIFISASDSKVVNDVMAQINFLLRKLHGLAPGTDDDFSVVSQSDFLSTLSAISTTLTVFLGAIAAISLLVGGIGIMNIMLVSVTERTREIGIRLAIGALEREVLLQFLVEAVVLSSAGGGLGILIGLLTSFGLTEALDVPFVFKVSIVVIAFLFSAAVGVIFGYFPALKAANLDPIEALRHE